jgi:Protein of unknown function (DUF3800)
MATSYYIDESGHTGDLAQCDDSLKFDDQPVFSMASIGVADQVSFEKEMQRLVLKHKISTTELKSSSLRRNASIVSDAINFVCSTRLPYFIEVVDKKYFLCMQIINCHVFPPILGISYRKNEVLIRQTFADYIYDHAPLEVFSTFLKACREPSEMAVWKSFQSTLRFSRSAQSNRDVSSAIHTGASFALMHYDFMRREDKNAHFAFLPIPDASKHQKNVWILPNIPAFSNIYARINLFQKGDLSSVAIIHDENVHIDEMLKDNKRILESLLKEGHGVYTQNADYVFRGSAPLAFAKSHETLGIQLADLIAGLVMRIFKDRINGKLTANIKFRNAYDALLTNSNPQVGIGLNLVVPDRFA